MNHENLLLMAALLGMSAHAFAGDAAPPKINVVVIDETDRGCDKGVLDRYGIASRASRLNRGPQAEALRETLGDANVRMRLVVPTACPAAGTRDACASVRRIKDVDLPNVIGETRNSTLLVLWPEAAYFPQQQLYAAYLDVDVLEKGKAVSGSVLRRLPRLEVRRRLRQYSVRSLREGAGRDGSLRPRNGAGGADAIGAGDVAKQAARGERLPSGPTSAPPTSATIAWFANTANACG